MSTILHIVAAPASGGAETFVRDLTCAMASRGHALHLVFIDRAVDLERDTEFENVFLARLGKNKVSYSFLGHEVRHKPWLGISRLRSIVKDKGVDLIHSHLAFGNVFAIGVAGIPLIYTHHSENIRFPRAYWLYFRYRVSCFIGISEACSNNLRGYVGVRSKVELVRNGIDLSTIKKVSLGAVSEGGKIRAVCVGRITELKNYPFLAESIAKLGVEYRDRIVVDIFGEGDDEIVSVCMNILAKANVQKDTMRFLGVNSNIRSVLSNYDVFLMSSSSEGLPIALIEATAAGLPTVVTDVGGCRELVETGPTGLVVPSSDASAFGDALKTMIDAPELRKDFAMNSKKTVEAYSIEQTVSHHLKIYNEVIGL